MESRTNKPRGDCLSILDPGVLSASSSENFLLLREINFSLKSGKFKIFYKVEAKKKALRSKMLTNLCRAMRT